MILFKKVPMKIEEKEYEIRVLYDESVINVVAFLNNHPVNGYRRQIIIPKKADSNALLEKGVVSDLIESAKNDLIEQKWENLMKLI